MDDHIEETELKFKPLTPGLGLNHFSDSVPFAPQAQRVKKPVNFQFPKNPPHSSLPEKNDLTSKSPVNLDSEPAGRTKRIFAYGLDCFFLCSIFALVLTLAFKWNDIILFSLPRKALVPFLWPLALFFSVVYLGYFSIQEVIWKTTLAKALFRINLSSESTSARFIRILFFFVSAIPLGLGLIWSLFDEKKRCWHDVVTAVEVQQN